MIKILNRIETGVAVGQSGVVLSWRSDEATGRETFSSDFISSAWSLSSKDLETELKALVDKVGMRDSSVSLSLPDSVCHMAIHSFAELPGSLKERENLIKWTVAKNLHIPEVNLSIDYHILNSGAEPIKIMSVAVEKNIISLYEEVLKKTGLNVWSAAPRTLHSLSLLTDVARGLSNYSLLYYGSDYFTIIIFKDDTIDFIRTKALSGGVSIRREASTTLKSYLGKNAGYELEKFFVLTEKSGDLKDLGIGEVEFIDSDALLDKLFVNQGGAPTELLLPSVGSIKS